MPISPVFLVGGSYMAYSGGELCLDVSLWCTLCVSLMYSNEILLLVCVCVCVCVCACSYMAALYTRVIQLLFCVVVLKVL